MISARDAPCNAAHRQHPALCYAHAHSVNIPMRVCWARYLVHVEDFIGVILLVFSVQFGHLVGQEEEHCPAEQQGGFPEDGIREP